VPPSTRTALSDSQRAERRRADREFARAAASEERRAPRRRYLASWSEGTDLSVIEDAAGLIDRLAKRIEDTVLPFALDASTASEPEHDAEAVTA
jgi:hypothetical protein